MELLEKNPRSFLIGLLGFAAIFVFVGMGQAQLIDWDENIYAEISKQMLIRGDLLATIVNNTPFTHKPPFFYWEQVLSYKIFGVNEFAARFPSGVAALGMILLCYFVGAKLKSKSLGLIWGLLYLTSFLPSVLARAAVIDHTFNLFIASGTFFLYLFDINFRNFLKQEKESLNRTRFSYLKYLTLAGVCLGLAVLTKGPLGGVIPLVAFGVYKLFYRSPPIKLLHFLYLGTLSLSIALSWFLANYLVHGAEFIKGFAQFMANLFTKSLEGHEGPFYYHFVVVIFGLLPWTPFLFAEKRANLFKESEHYRPIFILGISWTLFVLLLMSAVSTKLPHHSASVYVPLTLYIAAILDYRLRHKLGFGWKRIAFYLILSLALSGFLMAAPFLMQKYIDDSGVQFQVQWTSSIFYVGVVQIVLISLGGWLFFKKRLLSGVLVSAVFMLVVTLGMWRYQVPIFLSYSQQPLLDMVREIREEKKGKVVFYRFVSFAAVYYGNEPIDIIYTSIFPGDPSVLEQRDKEDIYVITADKNYKRKIIKEYPDAKYVEDRGAFSLFILPSKRSTSPLPR